MLGHQRQKPTLFYAKPEHRSRWRQLLWRLGFDPLTKAERIEQLRTEADYWRNDPLEPIDG